MIKWNKTKMLQIKKLFFSLYLFLMQLTAIPCMFLKSTLWFCLMYREANNLQWNPALRVTAISLDYITISNNHIYMQFHKGNYMDKIKMTIHYISGSVYLSFSLLQQSAVPNQYRIPQSFGQFSMQNVLMPQNIYVANYVHI